MSAITLDFEDLRYTVTLKQGKPCRKTTTQKDILKGISGQVLPGDLVALMGASGAGKTTLLNVLSRQITRNTGQVLANGVDVDKVPLGNRAAFIQQEDEFFGLLTVTEHLEQQAALRIPAGRAELKERVETVIEQFSLTKSRNSRIGNVQGGAGRGISGGEKKRLSVATELLANPPLIFADEPTSGLDAFMAESVVATLKQLADDGHTIVCTIHQPASDVFRMFNKVMLLSEGQVIYFGPRLGAVPYFLRLGRPCPSFTNPADFLIDELAINWDNADEQLDRMAKWAEEWRVNGQEYLREFEDKLRHKLEIEEAAELREAAAGTLQQLQQPPKELQHYQPPEGAKVSALTVWGTLMQRTILSNARNPMVVRARMVQAMVTAIFTGLIYLRLAKNQWYSRVGCAFNMMLTMAFITVFSCIVPILNEKRLVLRERDGGLYGLATYIGTKILSDTVFQIHLPLLFVTILWWMAGLRDSFVQYLLGLAMVWLVAQSTASMGYIIAAVSPNFGVALALGPLFILATLMVCGFVYSKDTIPKPWIWLYYISPFTYGFSAVLRAVFLGFDFGSPDPTSLAPFSKGEEVLDSLGISTEKSRWVVDILVLLVWIIGGRALAMMGYCWFNRRKHR